MWVSIQKAVKIDNFPITDRSVRPEKHQVHDVSEIPERLSDISMPKHPFHRHEMCFDGWHLDRVAEQPRITPPFLNGVVSRRRSIDELKSKTGVDFQCELQMHAILAPGMDFRALPCCQEPDLLVCDTVQMALFARHAEITMELSVVNDLDDWLFLFSLLCLGGHLDFIG